MEEAAKAMMTSSKDSLEAAVSCLTLDQLHPPLSQDEELKSQDYALRLQEFQEFLALLGDARCLACDRTEIFRM